MPETILSESNVISSTQLRLPMCIYMSIVHAVAIYAFFLLAFGSTSYKPSFGTLVFSFVLCAVSGLGITAGAHRLWAHRSYNAVLSLRLVLMISNSIANQGSILWWSREHRAHHRFTETNADPHNSNRGFFYSHVGWMLIKKHPDAYFAVKKTAVEDLKRDPVVAFQDFLCPWWNLFFCFAFPTLLNPLLTGDSMMNGLLFAGFLRYTIILHCTWCVNSIVHRWGYRPYDHGSMTTENPIVAFLALGEGWHNWHHTFDWDYSTAEMGCTSQYNPTKLFIDIMYYLGLAKNLKRALPDAWEHRKQRIIENLSKEKGGTFEVRETLRGFRPFMYKDVDFIRKEDVQKSIDTSD